MLVFSISELGYILQKDRSDEGRLSTVKYTYELGRAIAMHTENRHRHSILLLTLKRKSAQNETQEYQQRIPNALLIHRCRYLQQIQSLRLLHHDLPILLIELVPSQEPVFSIPLLLRQS